MIPHGSCVLASRRAVLGRPVSGPVGTHQQALFCTRCRQRKVISPQLMRCYPPSMIKWTTRFRVGEEPSPAESAVTSMADGAPEGRPRAITGRLIQAAALVLPVAAIAILAAALRLNALGAKPLWLDETITGTTASLPSLDDALRYAAIWPDRAPLNFFMTWVLGFLGREDFAVRLPYAVAGILAAVSMYWVGSRLYGRTAGCAAGVLMAILPFSLHYSQEAGPTVLVMWLTIPLMLAAHGAAHQNRVRDWALLALWAALDLYSSYLAVPVVGVAYGYVGLVHLPRLAAAARSRSVTIAVNEVRRFAPAILSLVVLAVAMWPWVGHFRVFLSRPDTGFSRVDAAVPLTVDSVSALLAAFGLSGVALTLFVAGLVTAAVDLARGQWRRSALPLLWLVLPIVYYYLRVGGGIVTISPHYFVEVFPAALLIAAIGVHGVIRAICWAGRRAWELRAGASERAEQRNPRWLQLGTTAVGLVLVAIVVRDAWPTVVAGYDYPNGSDYRGAVDRILAADSAHPVVLAFGHEAPWNIEIGMRYYAWVRHSTVEVVDGASLDNHSLSVLRAATSVWGAARLTPDYLGANPPGPIPERYQDTLLLPPDTTDNLNRSSAILHWASAIQPELAADADLIDFVQGNAVLGPELLPGPTASSTSIGPPLADRWTLHRNVSISADGHGFLMEPSGGEVNAIYTTSSLQSSADYLLSFRCDNSAMSGRLGVYVVVQTPAGAVVFPNGGGYDCVGSPGQPSETAVGVIQFSMIPTATAATIWARATGNGVGRYSDFSLHQLR